ncbi:MAG: hypothetical protein WAT16_00300 [Saprospiraceae bacterium]|nr:hypothetical protein [Saprospiraceae bacterium]
MQEFSKLNKLVGVQSDLESKDKEMMIEFLKKLKEIPVPQLKSLSGNYQYMTIMTIYKNLIDYLEFNTKA